MNTLPKFLLADNTDFPEELFIIHTEFPRFILRLNDDEVEWLEEFDSEDQQELEQETETLLEQAYDFYEREISRYE